MLVASVALLHAFGRDALLFAVAYLIVRLVHLALFSIAGRGDRDLFHAVVRTLPGSTLAPVLLIVAAFVDGWPQLALWGMALAILYLAPLIGRMRGFQVSPDHFVERFGLIMIIALGESIVAIGTGAAALHLDAGVISAALLGFVVAACLWWSYFDWSVYAAQGILAERTGPDRAALARDVYSYLHLPMVAGIVLFAFGVKTALPRTADTLALLPAVCLSGGIALYLVAHVAMRLRLGGGWGRGRPVAAVVLLVLVPVATAVPSLASLALVAATCVALIAYEYLRHRVSRAWIRERRGAFTMDEARQIVERDPRPGRRRTADADPSPGVAEDVPP
jgi:low temperature requirement protein LtrA